VDGGGFTERVRGVQRKTNKLPHPQVSREFPGKVETCTSFVIGKIVSRLEMDSRWALARSVSGLVAERDAWKERLESVSTGSVILRLRLPLQCARLWLYIAFVLSLRGRQ
jgi:hypothetical protein